MLAPQITTSCARLFGDRLEARGTHLARRPDGEPLARDQKGVAGMDPCTEVGHEVERPDFQRSSSVSRLSETQSAAGVIWSV
jgi:hypothetical protein